MQKMRVLVTGVASLLGKYLVDTISKEYELFGAYHINPLDSPLLPKDRQFLLDITDKSQVRSLVKSISPQAIIHLASISDIDYCETHKDEAWHTNVDGSINLLAAIKSKKTHIIYLSSNVVFGGNHAPYKEDDAKSPRNFYGKTKAYISKLLLSGNLPATIVRSTSMFGWPPKGARDNDVTLYLKQIKTEEKLYLVNDRFFNPVYALRTAQAIKKIIAKTSTGKFHIGGKDRITRYTYVKRIIRVFAPDYKGSLIPVPSFHFPSLAKRPVDGTLNTDKILRVLGITPKTILSDLKLMQLETIKHKSQLSV